MPNAFAQFMILFWPVVTLVIFRYFSIPKSIAISVTAGYLLLPTRAQYDITLLPTIDKDLVAVLPALIIAAIKANAKAHSRQATPDGTLHFLPGWIPRQKFILCCVIGILVGPVLTSLNNDFPLRYGPTFLPALGLWEAGSSVLNTIAGLLPFFVARKFFAQPQEHRMLLGVICVAGLAYTLPALYEIRMSPQLNTMIYGFFPHGWLQHIRGNGYRPLVFLQHGLRISIFFACAFIALAGLFRTEKGQRTKFIIAAIWLMVTLVLCKSLTGFLVALVFGPVIVFFGVRGQLLFASIVAAVVLVYPTMRGAGLVPIDQTISMISQFADPDRISSLEYRLRNEEALVERTNEQPLFGWGRFGRNMVYDPETGGSTAFPEGSWIITFSIYGWVGYLSTFGLLTIPIILLALKKRQDIAVSSSILAVVLAGNLVDLIPNSGLSPVTWMIAGAIAGRLELSRVKDKHEQPALIQASRSLPYSRPQTSAAYGRSR